MLGLRIRFQECRKSFPAALKQEARVLSLEQFTFFPARSIPKLPHVPLEEAGYLRGALTHLLLKQVQQQHEVHVIIRCLVWLDPERFPPPWPACLPLSLHLFRPGLHLRSDSLP
jgi:hypothetical protein